MRPGGPGADVGEGWEGGLLGPPGGLAWPSDWCLVCLSPSPNSACLTPCPRTFPPLTCAGPPAQVLPAFDHPWWGPSPALVQPLGSGPGVTQVQRPSTRAKGLTGMSSMVARPSWCMGTSCGHFQDREWSRLGAPSELGGWRRVKLPGFLLSCGSRPPTTCDGRAEGGHGARVCPKPWQSLGSLGTQPRALAHTLRALPVQTHSCEHAGSCTPPCALTLTPCPSLCLHTGLCTHPVLPNARHSQEWVFLCPPLQGGSVRPGQWVLSIWATVLPGFPPRRSSLRAHRVSAGSGRRQRLAVAVGRPPPLPAALVLTSLLKRPVWAEGASWREGTPSSCFSVGEHRAPGWCWWGGVVCFLIKNVHRMGCLSHQTTDRGPGDGMRVGMPAVLGRGGHAQVTRRVGPWGGTWFQRCWREVRPLACRDGDSDVCHPELPQPGEATSPPSPDLPTSAGWLHLRTKTGALPGAPKRQAFSHLSLMAEARSLGGRDAAPWGYPAVPWHVSSKEH